MINFMKNVLVGLGGLAGIILVLLVLTFLGGGLWLILSAIGLVTIGMVRFLAWLLIGGGATIAVLWLIGYLLSGHKNAD